MTMIMKKILNSFLSNLALASLVNGILFIFLIRFFDFTVNPFSFIATVNIITAIIVTLIRRPIQIKIRNLDYQKSIDF